MARGKNWTKKEDNTLIENKHLSDKELTKLIDRSESSIKTRRYRLDLGERAKVTEEDLQYLKNNYEVKTTVQLAEDLGFHRSTVEKHLKELGIYISEKDKAWVPIDVSGGMEDERFFVEIEYEYKGVN